MIDSNGGDHFDTNGLVRRRKTTPPAPIPENPEKDFTIFRPSDASDLVPPAQWTRPGSKVTIIEQPQPLVVNTPSNPTPALRLPKETQGRSTRF